MTSKTKYFYISDPLFQTVKDSQVLNWLEVIGKNGIIFDLILITRVSYIMKNSELRKEKIKKANQIISGKVRQLFILKNNDKTRISDIIILSYFILILFKICVIKRKKVIIQTRMGWIGHILHLITKMYKNVKVIFDCRGAGAEEFINGLGYNDINDVNDWEIKNRYYSILNKQKIMLTNSDYVFCVSEQLKKYALKIVKNKVIAKEKFFVVPGSADEDHFYINHESRVRLRKEYGIEDKFVLIYTGKLDLHWHNKEDIFKFVAGLMKADPVFFFMCITPEIESARQLSEAAGISKQEIFIKYVDYEEIPDYLNTADAGIILRDDIMTNRVASPTKIPEYLLCGLPVLISPNVGDYSDFVESNNLGVIINKNPDYTRIRNELLSNIFNRQIISQTGKSRYAKQRVVDQIIEIYLALISE